MNARPDGPLLVREEQQLVEGLLAGNEDAVRQLYARYARPIFTLGLRLLGSSEAAEELTQDVFLAAWRKAARFDPSRGRLSTWLMTIAHNLAVDRLRRETGVTRPHLVLVDQMPEVVGADEDEVLMERDAAIRALESLSDAEKRLLARAYFGGLTAREIAEADGIPLGTVKTRLADRADQGAPREPGQGTAVMTADATLTCLEVRDLLPEFAVGVLADEERARVERHLRWCAGCRKESSDLGTAAATFGFALAPAPMPVGLARPRRRSREARGRGPGRRRAGSERSPRRSSPRSSRSASLGWGAVMAGRAERFEDARSRRGGSAARMRSTSSQVLLRNELVAGRAPDQRDASRAARPDGRGEGRRSRSCSSSRRG